MVAAGDFASVTPGDGGYVEPPVGISLLELAAYIHPTEDTTLTIAPFYLLLAKNVGEGIVAATIDNLNDELSTPEPASVSLLMIGALTMGLRRRRARS